jgi:hypothetical protein
VVRAGQLRAGGRERPGTLRSKVHGHLPTGMRDRPTCAHDAGWGDRRFGTEPRLFDKRWMHVSQQTRAIGDGRRADGVLTRDHATPGWGRCSFAVPSPVAWRRCLWSRGATASAPDCLSGGCGFESRRLRPGSCSSPVERLAEAQRGAGSIPARATFLPPWRNAYARRSERRGPRAREGSNASGGICKAG